MKINMICFREEEGTLVIESYDPTCCCESCGTLGSWLIDDENCGIGLCKECLIAGYDQVYEVQIFSYKHHNIDGTTKWVGLTNFQLEMYKAIQNKIIKEQENA
jgi:late competence protein required for DNA uptake (superfamily II DNA/RNA helicase)